MCKNIDKQLWDHIEENVPYAEVETYGISELLLDKIICEYRRKGYTISHKNTFSAYQGDKEYSQNSDEYEYLVIKAVK